MTAATRIFFLLAVLAAPTAAGATSPLLRVEAEVVPVAEAEDANRDAAKFLLLAVEKGRKDGKASSVSHDMRPSGDPAPTSRDHGMDSEPPSHGDENAPEAGDSGRHHEGMREHGTMHGQGAMHHGQDPMHGQSAMHSQGSMHGQSVVHESEARPARDAMHSQEAGNDVGGMDDQGEAGDHGDMHSQESAGGHDSMHDSNDTHHQGSGAGNCMTPEPVGMHRKVDSARMHESGTRHVQEGTTPARTNSTTGAGMMHSEESDRMCESEDMAGTGHMGGAGHMGASGCDGTGHMGSSGDSGHMGGSGGSGHMGGSGGHR